MTEKMALDVEVAGKRYTIDIGGFTGREVRDFRNEFGFVPRRVFTDADMMDIDAIAGLVWLHKRRRNPNLSLGDVLDEVTYDNVDVVVPDGADDGDGEPDDPES